MPRLHHLKACLLLVSLYPLDSAAGNFTQCLVDMIDCAENQTSVSCTKRNISGATALSILRASDGSTVNDADNATGISFTGCYHHCTADQQSFSWNVFSQEFSAWLLPYLALLSQLPFGARRRTDNLMSAILTLGSPTLAGYSLYMTLLNARWLNDQLFLGIDYPSAVVRQSVVQALSSLQQVPLRVHPGDCGHFESLVVHPANDQWWSTFADELDYTHTWSIASATSITWVVVAYLLTVADSLSNVSDNLDSNGQGIGSVWLWLLPIVVGWLVLSPKCDHDRVKEAYNRANKQVFVPDSRDPSADPIQVTSDFGLTISPSPDWMVSEKNITSPDELRIPPVFNYARTLSWCRNAYVISLFYRTAWRKSNRRDGVSDEFIHGSIHNDVPTESRLGNRDQIIRYCRPHDRECSANKVLWPRGMFFNMIVASLMSLQMQWGTTSAAMLVVWYTPTIKLGCRSLAYLIYGGLSTMVWLLLVSSSILGYYAHHLDNDLPPTDSEGDAERTPLKFTPPSISRFTPGSIVTDNGPGFSINVAIPMRELDSPGIGAEEVVSPNADAYEHADTIAIRRLRQGRAYARGMTRVANWLRWIGKSVAIVNAIGIIASSVFQFAGVYNNCYCDSSVLGWGVSAAFNIISPNDDDISLATSAWTGALVLGLTSCVLFVSSIYLVRDSLPS